MNRLRIETLAIDLYWLMGKRSVSFYGIPDAVQDRHRRCAQGLMSLYEMKERTRR